MYRAVDVLGFAGGFTLGMVQAGFELVGKREMPGGFGVSNCEANKHLLGYHWKTEATDPTRWSVITADVVFGNPPCSGFSGMSAKHFRGAHSPINHCMWAFVDYVARARPLVAVFESVQLAFTRPDGLELMRALRAHLEMKTNEKWSLHHVLHNAYSVGGCSQRRRYFWVVSRIPFGIEWPTPDRSALPVLDDAIRDLEGLPESWNVQPHSYYSSASDWAFWRLRIDAHVDGHVAVRNPLTQRVVDLMQGVEWKPGEHLAQVARRHYETHGRLPDSWKYTEQKVVGSDFRMGFNTPVRWKGDEAARVITGSGCLTAVHPRLPRTLTHREVARIMGFPDDWLIEPLKSTPGLGMTWGKGITVDCGRWIGTQIHFALGGNPGTVTGLKIGEREHLIDVTNAWATNVVQLTPQVRKHQKLLGGIIMTEPVTEPVAAEGEAAPAAGKGRPRPAATIELDAKGLEILKNTPTGLTKEQLAEQLGVEVSKAYLVTYRLRTQGEIHKERADGKYVWKAGAAPAPSEAPAETPVVTAPEGAPAEPVAI